MKKRLSDKIDKNLTITGTKASELTVSCRQPQKELRDFVENDLQNPAAFSIIKLCVVVPDSAGKRGLPGRCKRGRGGLPCRQGAAAA
ncbi:MAG: hypothetical protein MR373_07605, partial [Faecalibacterium prausnitzii]|nr:hypothetical protein [Faecalibacterium prausnitzii]